jgi:hypothetical protein
MNEIVGKRTEDHLGPDDDDLLGGPSDALSQQPHVVDPLSDFADQSDVSVPIDYVSPAAG